MIFFMKYIKVDLTKYKTLVTYLKLGMIGIDSNVQPYYNYGKDDTILVNVYHKYLQTIIQYQKVLGILLIK